MTVFNLVFTDKARKDIAKIDKVSQRRLVKKLKFYIEQEDPISFAKKLVDVSEGQYRWRVGAYRIVFDVEGTNIAILRVQHRREVYR